MLDRGWEEPKECRIASSITNHVDKLLYFYEVAQAGSLMACSRKLSVSAPTISYAIKQLEQGVNSQLFSRTKKGMELTAAGQHLYNFCQKFFPELENVHLAMKNPQDRAITRVRVGTFQSVAIYFWPLLLKKIKDRPDISLSIRTGRSHRIMEALMSRDLDVALIVEGLQHKDLIRHEIYTDEYCTYLSSDFKKDRLTEQEIRDMTLMYIPNAIDGEGLTLKQHVYMTGLKLKDIFELDSFEAIAEFVKQGHGMGVLPKKVASRYGDALKEVYLEGTEKKYFGRHRFFLSYRNDLDLPQALMNLLLDSAKDSVKDIVV